MNEELNPIAAQSAPDEREAFEAAYAKSQGIAEKAYPLWFERHGDGYTSSSVNASWWGWQQHGSWQRAQSAPVVPEGWRLVKVSAEGVQFGNAWFSHESITGYTAEQLNSGNCRVTGRAYVDWLAAAPQPAAPVAECTNEDSWNCKYCRKTETCAALKDERNFGAPPKAARQEQGDGMCNADEPSNRCICREEFGYKVCGPRGTEVHQLRRALEHARLFIRNGIDLGYIRMPDADTPDPAHETLPMIDAALSASAEGK